jgi:alanyl-tRNA synthetase
VSFHLGAETSTIDLAREVSAAEIDEAEEAANRVVWEDRPVTIRFATPEEASRLPLRKEPTRTGPLRLIEVPDFDLSACGGTHVARTGTIGIIAVAAAERFKGATRVTFVCGHRALASYRALRNAVEGATRCRSYRQTWGRRSSECAPRRRLTAARSSSCRKKSLPIAPQLFAARQKLLAPFAAS